MAIQIKKAVRQRVWLKMAIMGPSGSGKTYGGIALAKGLAPTGKILLVDTENGSSNYYADKWDFDVAEMHAPFTSQKYMDALAEAVELGYEVIVFDSLSHEWASIGGVLDKKATLDRTKGEKWGNWQDAKTPHSLFREAWLQAPIHVIATMRSKMEYVLEANEKGKQVPRKVGLAPIQEGDAEYEFGIAFEVDRDSHLATASKDRTGLFDGRNFHIGEGIGKELGQWLSTGAAFTPAPEPSTSPTTAERIASASAEADALAAARNAPLPENFNAAAGELFTGLANEKKAEADTKVFPPEVEAFANDIADGPVKWASPEDVAEILVAAQQGKVDQAKLAAYLHKKGWMPNVKDWMRISQAALKPIMSHLTSEKLTAFKAHLASHSPM